MALQIVNYPSNSLAAFLVREKDRLIALVEQEHEEALRNEGKNLVVGSSSASPRPARVSTISSKQQQNAAIGPGKRKRKSARRSVKR